MVLHTRCSERLTTRGHFRLCTSGNLIYQSRRNHEDWEHGNKVGTLQPTCRHSRTYLESHPGEHAVQVATRVLEEEEEGDDAPWVQRQLPVHKGHAPPVRGQQVPATAGTRFLMRDEQPRVLQKELFCAAPKFMT